jgi:long-chain acyl-CoA synthetase
MQQFQSPLEAFLYWEAKIPASNFLIQPTKGKTIIYTYESAGKEIRKIASALKSYDLADRSHVALLSKNCAHWIMADLAIMMAGHVSIPIYPTLNAKSIELILNHSESKAIIIGKLDNYESQRAGIKDIHKISVGLYSGTEGDLWEDLLINMEPLKSIYPLKGEDLMTIIYTSGTTGTPKGVMHTAGNIMISARTLFGISGLSLNSRTFSYLPLAHIAERVGIEIGSITYGCSMSFPYSLETFAADLENTQPHLFFAVPRIWAKFSEKILETLPQKKLDMLLKIPIINGIIKNKLKQKLGLKHAVFICSGAAPLSSSLINWYGKLNITIHQVYGMTEDCAISHICHAGASKVGTVGRPQEGVKAKLSPEGEICIKNNCLMTGYYKAPDITASVFDEQGYLKTGDIGEYDHDGFLTITGRVKDQFKTDKGKYISPAPIELVISENTDIEQICIVGTGIPQPIALITLSTVGQAKSKESISQSLIESVNSINPKLEKHEKIEKVIIMSEEWNVDNGLTTPTLKLKRNSIEKIHQDRYGAWFKGEEKVIFE